MGVGARRAALVYTEFASLLRSARVFFEIRRAKRIACISLSFFFGLFAVHLLLSGSLERAPLPRRPPSLRRLRGFVPGSPDNGRPKRTTRAPISRMGIDAETLFLLATVDSACTVSESGSRCRRRVRTAALVSSSGMARIPGTPAHLAVHGLRAFPEK